MLKKLTYATLVLLMGLLLTIMTDETANAADKAPEKFKVKFETTAGDFVVEVQRALAPNGADRFHELVEAGFYDECRFFRVVPKFIVQFGINGDPEVQKKWRVANIKDDPVKTSNKKGTITFATAGPNTRTSQLFINFADNDFLDRQGFSPFGSVSSGMDVVEKINPEYTEKPDQGKIQSQGNEYLKKQFPNLDYIKKASVVKDEK